MKIENYVQEEKVIAIKKKSMLWIIFLPIIFSLVIADIMLFGELIDFNTAIQFDSFNNYIDEIKILFIIVGFSIVFKAVLSTVNSNQCAMTETFLYYSHKSSKAIYRIPLNDVNEIYHDNRKTSYRDSRVKKQFYFLMKNEDVLGPVVVDDMGNSKKNDEFTSTILERLKLFNLSFEDRAHSLCVFPKTLTSNVLRIKEMHKYCIKRPSQWITHFIFLRLYISLLMTLKYTLIFYELV